MNPPRGIPAAVLQIGPNSLIYAAGDIVARGAAFLLLPLYTLALTTTEYGIYGITLSLVAVLNVLLPMQMQAAVTVQYFQVEVERRHELITAAAICLGVSALVTSVVLLVTRRLWASAVFSNAFTEPYVLLAIGIAAFTAAGAIPQALMRLREQARLLVGLTAGTYLLGLGLGVYALLALRMGVMGLLWGLLIANALALLVYVLFLGREVTSHISKHWFRDVIVLALPLVPHMLAHWGLNLMDRVILPRFVSLSDVGIYQLGYQLGTLFQIVVLAVNAAWVPFLFQRLGEPSAFSELRQVSNWLIYGQAWMGLGIALLIPEAAILVVAPAFHDSVTVIPWVVLGFFMVAIYHMWVNLLLFRKRTVLVPVATLLAALANLGLNLLLIPHFGYIGAAMTTAACYAILAALTGLMVHRAKIGFPYEYSKWLVAAAIAGVLYLLGSQFGYMAAVLRWASKLLLWAIFPFMLRIVGLGIPSLALTVKDDRN